MNARENQPRHLPGQEPEKTENRNVLDHRRTPKEVPDQEKNADSSTTEPAPAEENGMKETATKLLIGLALLVVIAIGIWAAITAVRLTPAIISMIGGWFSDDEQALNLTLSNPTVEAGTPVTLSWEFEAEEDAFFTLTYACVEGFRFEVPLADERAPIACETPYTIPGDIQSVQLIPFSEASSIDMPIMLSYATEDEADIAEATASLTVTNPQAPVDGTDGEDGEDGQDGVDGEDGTNGTGGTPTPPTAPQVADLRTQLVAFGTLNPTTNEFMPNTTAHADSIVAIRFEVANIGTKATGPWAFTAELPTSPHETFRSVTQQSLNPGDRVVYTLSFNKVVPNGVFSIVANPSNQVPESSSANNGISYTVQVVQ